MDPTFRQMEAPFFRVFHASSNSMAITTADEGRFIDINDSCIRLMGRSREEIIGRTSLELGLWRDCHHRQEAIGKLKQTGKLQETSFRVENSASKSTGGFTVLVDMDIITLWERPHVLITVTDITDREQEQESAALRKSQEISEWRKTEEELRQSREYLSQIINGIGDSLVVMDRDHRTVLANDSHCEALGRSRGELLGKSARDLWQGAQAERCWKLEEEVMATGRELVTEETGVDRDGATRHLLVSRRVLVAKSGDIQLLCAVRDITDYKQLQAQFLQAQKMEAIGVLAGGIAHDFNNLLNVINGYADVVLKEMGEDNPTRNDIAQIREAGLQAAALTAQLLAFSRKQIIRPEILNLNEVIGNMAVMLRRLIGEDITLSTAEQPDLWQISADPGQMHQVIMNLAVNARDAMPHGGKLRLETANIEFREGRRKLPVTDPGPYVRLTIGDTGVGMDAVTQSHLFEPFFTTKGKGKGTGLGLSTVYGIVTQNRGVIGVRSEPGKGTTFEMYFPRAEGAVVETPGEAESTESSVAETILVAEDEPSLLALAARILRDRGYRVLEAHDGKEALRLARECKEIIHLILTDAVMPGMGGKQVVELIEAARPGIKSLYMSGYTDNAIVQHGILNADIAFIQKPFTVETLTRKVREVLDSPPMH